MTQPRVLIVEDEEITADNLRLLFEDNDFDVDVAGDGDAALRAINERRYDLLILDLFMPRRHGMDVLQVLYARSGEKPCIIVITAYPDTGSAVRAGKLGASDYVHKPLNLGQLLEKSRKCLEDRKRRRQAAAQPVERKQCLLTLRFDRFDTVTVESKGAYTHSKSFAAPFDSRDLDRLARRGRHVGLFMFSHDSRVQRIWRVEAKEIGQELFGKLFKTGDVAEVFYAARSTVDDPANLKIVFKGPRDFLALPLEFLFERDWLALSHPMSRAVVDTPTRKNPDFQKLLAGLRERGEPFRALLIASNTRPPIEAADKEVCLVKDLLTQKLNEAGLAADITHLPTEAATREAVLEHLRTGDYHLLHYAGHGYYNPEHPESSGLSFWSEPDRKGKVKRVTMRDLRAVLREPSLRFAYLSACQSAASGDEDALFEDDYLGVAEGFVQMDVPAVWGYRWAVGDDAALQMAKTFYTGLFDHQDLSKAALEARLAGRPDVESGVWLAPLLIVQE